MHATGIYRDGADIGKLTNKRLLSLCSNLGLSGSLCSNLGLSGSQVHSVTLDYEVVAKSM